MNSIINCKLLSSNVLKIIAVISMLIDHIGAILFPDIIIFRIIGRLAFPIFAFLISEGCRYTSNKKRYFLIMVILGVLFQIIQDIFNPHTALNILLTFSISILLIYLLQLLKNNQYKIIIKISLYFAFIAIITAVFFFNKLILFDYGFWGIMLPVFASIFHYNGTNETLQLLDNKRNNLISFAICLIILIFVDYGFIQIFSILSLPLLALYSGKRGKYNMKYFFYIFYISHLTILYIIREIISACI